MMMAKIPNFPNKIIIVKKILEIVKELIGFFTGKLQIIQSKLKVLSQGIEPCIPPILDDSNMVQEWNNFSNVFHTILTQEATMAIFKDIGDAPFHNLIDSQFRVEIDFKKSIIKSKAITYSK